MNDPAPENIAGKKMVTHSVSHEIQWGYVAVGVGLLLLAFVVSRAFANNRDDDQEGFSTL